MVQNVSVLLTILAAAASSVSGLAIEKRRADGDNSSSFKLQIYGGGKLNGKFLAVNTYVVSSDEDKDLRVVGLPTVKSAPSASENGNPLVGDFKYGWDHSHETRTNNYLRFYDEATIFQDDQDFNAGFKSDRGALFVARVSSVFDTWDDVTYSLDLGFDSNGFLTVGGAKDLWNICPMKAPGEIKDKKQVLPAGFDMQVLAARKIVHDGCVPVKVKKA